MTVNYAGLWPHWHALTRAVAGVIDRPFHVGDHIYEFVRTPEGVAELKWEIVELDRPR